MNTASLHTCPHSASSMIRSQGPVLFIWTFFVVFSTYLFYNSFHSFVERFWNTYNSVLTFHSFISPPSLAKPFQSTSSVLRFGSCLKHSKQVNISESKYAFCHILADACGHQSVFPSSVASQVFFPTSISVPTIFNQNAPSPQLVFKLLEERNQVRPMSSSQEPSPRHYISASYAFPE